MRVFVGLNSRMFPAEPVGSAWRQTLGCEGKIVSTRGGKDPGGTPGSQEAENRLSELSLHSGGHSRTACSVPEDSARQK
jgi:hypothetical protein